MLDQRAHQRIGGKLAEAPRMNAKKISSRNKLYRRIVAN
jgi:hypothetical protein